MAFVINLWAQSWVRRALICATRRALETYRALANDTVSVSTFSFCKMITPAAVNDLVMEAMWNIEHSRQEQGPGRTWRDTWCKPRCPTARACTEGTHFE